MKEKKTAIFRINKEKGFYEASFYDRETGHRLDLEVSNYGVSAYEQERLFFEIPCEYGDCPDSTLTEDTCGCDCTNCPFAKTSDYEWEVLLSSDVWGEKIADNEKELKEFVIRVLEGQLDSLPKDEYHQPPFNRNITKKLKALEWEFVEADDGGNDDE